ETGDRNTVNVEEISVFINPTAHMRIVVRAKHPLRDRANALDITHTAYRRVTVQVIAAVAVVKNNDITAVVIIDTRTPHPREVWHGPPARSLGLLRSFPHTTRR